MRKLFKWLGVTVSIFLILVCTGVGYIKFLLPNVGEAPELKVEITPDRVERGKYLAHSVTVCMDCHSKRDWSVFSGPITPGTLGAGGDIFDRNMGFPGVFYSKNITPAGLKDWTDGEIFRAITTGVGKEDNPLFPVMPYHSYGKMDPEDVYSIIAYIRTLPAIQSTIPEREVDFPFSLILHTIPQQATPGKMPDPSDSVAYGKYLVNAAACADCHTKFEKGQFIAGTEFGGGRVFELAGGTLTSSNISPDASGLGYWSREKFIQTFKQYQDSAYTSPKLGPSDYNTIMPWVMYSSMTESDLSSIYQYLRTVTPIENEVIKFKPRETVAAK